MGFFSSKRKTTNTSTNYNSSFGIGGDNDGLAISGDNNNVTQTDFGAVEKAFDSILVASDGANTLAELSIMTASENSNTFMSLAGDVVESNANLSNTFGENLSYLTDSVIDGNFALTGKVLDNNNYLVEGFATGLENSAIRESELKREAIASNAALASQFSSDLLGATDRYSSDLTDLTATSLQQNAQLVDNFGSNLSDLTSQTQNALVEMAVLQEAGLDNALQIAGSLGTEDNSEASQNMVKYVMLGVAAIGAVMVVKS